jgi:hypothetical protein
MSAGRHAAVGKPDVNALESATSMPLLSAVILVQLALFGLAIYWATVATNLELYGALSLLWLAFLIKAVVKRREDRWFPWLATGALLTTTLQFATTLAKHRHWPASSLHSLALVGDVVLGVVAAWLAVVAVIWFRTSGLPWLRRRFAQC